MTEQEATGESQRDNLPMKGCRAESERIRCYRAALISNWRKQEIIRRKEEASYIGDNIGKCNHRITGLCSRRKHLFYGADRSSRIISLPERDQKRGQEDQEEEYKQDHLDGRGEGQQVDGVLTTEKSRFICCILWMWYIFILTRNLNSILIRARNATRNKAGITTSEIRWESKTSSHRKYKLFKGGANLTFL